MMKKIILTCGIALELAAIYYLEKKIFTEGVKRACEFYNVNTPSEGLIIILEQSKRNHQDKES